MRPRSFLHVGAILALATPLAVVAAASSAGAADKGATQTLRGAVLVSVERSSGPVGPELVVTTTDTFDDKGRLLSSVSQVDFDGDGRTDEVRSTTATRDRDLVLEWLYELDVDADGLPDSRNRASFTYDKGELVEVVTEDDPGADGIAVSTTRESIESTKKPVTTTRTTRRDTDGDGTPDAIVVGTSTFDKKGLELETVEDTDLDADGTVDEQVRTTRTFTKDGAVAEEVTTRSLDGAPAETLDRAEYAYDSKGRLVGVVQTSAAEVVTTTVFYDKDGYTGSVTERDRGADDTPDERVTDTRTYDDRGRAAVDERLEEFLDGSRPSIRTTISLVYDDSGRATEQNVSVDESDDGSVDQTQALRYAYDSKDRVVENESSARRFDATAGELVLAYRATTTYTYDPKGLVLTVVIVSDDDGDGTIDTNYSLTRSVAAASAP